VDTTRLHPTTPSVVEVPTLQRPGQKSGGLSYGSIPEKFIPKITQSLIPKTTAAIEDLPAALDKALEEPTGQLRLQDFLESNYKIAVVISDKTRRLPRLEMIEALHRELPHIPFEQFTFVIANGTHKPCRPDELGLPKEVIDRYRWVSHNAIRWRDLRYIGRTPWKMGRFYKQIFKGEFKKSWRDRKIAVKNWVEAVSTFNLRMIRELALMLLPVRLGGFFLSGLGMPIFLNKEMLKADWIISIGQIQPHYFCGFSGGIKNIFPGVAAKASIAFNHFMKIHPTARLGSLQNNIVRDDLETVARLMPNITILNVVGGRDRKVHGVVAGDPILAHRKGSDISREGTLCKIKERTDIVVVSASNPLGKSIYQFVKACAPAGRAVKPGGTIIATASCSDGIGGDILVINQIMFRNGVRNYLPNNVEIRLVSGAEESEVRKTFFSPSPSIGRALEEAIAKHGEGAQITVIPEASHLLVVDEKTN